MIIAFLGKGGVGKTSISSAVALNLAERGPTAIVSTDFMSSLRHIFPGDKENLHVVELGEKEVAERWKAAYGDQVKSVLDDFVDVDDWILDHVATSPGVAEEFMIANVVDLEKTGRYRYIVWDTAASSSTMHLLYLEKEFYEHLDRDVKIMLKLRDRFRSSKTFRILQEWKDLANSVWQELLKAAFYLVTTEDELSLIQLDEIGTDLASMGIRIRGKILNRIRGTPGKDSAMTAEIPELEGGAMEIVSKMRINLTGIVS